MNDLEIIPLDGEQRIIDRLIRVAKKSKCRRSKCGAVIINHSKGFGGQFIGEGYNSQPCDIDGECFKDSLPANFKSDKTCCIHAEVRAINSTPAYHMNKGGVLYFMRLDDKGEPESCGEPYCTICSKA